MSCSVWTLSPSNGGPPCSCRRLEWLTDGLTRCWFSSFVGCSLARFDGREKGARPLWSRVRNNGNWPFTDGAFLLPSSPPHSIFSFLGKSRGRRDRFGEFSFLYRIRTLLCMLEGHSQLTPRLSQTSCSINDQNVRAFFSSYSTIKERGGLILYLVPKKWATFIPEMRGFMREGLSDFLLPSLLTHIY